MSLGRQDVVTIFTGVVTRRRVVADGEGQGCTGVNIAEPVAHHGCAADVSRTLPDDLREVAPVVELVHVGGRGTVGFRVVTDLVVVHQVADQDPNLVLLHTVTNVLTVATTIDRAMKIMLAKPHVKLPHRD